MLKPDWRRGLLIALALASIITVETLTPPDRTAWHYLYARLYYLPIVFAALSFGWRGGLVTALISGAAITLQAPPPGESMGLRREHIRIELVSFCSFAAVAGFLAERQRRQKQQYKEMAQQLSSVYETLQNNFEGMKRAERLSALGQLSAGLAHEIRNPLASIAGAAEILKRTGPGDLRAAKCLDIIDSECRRLNGLLTNFLKFARPRPPKYQTVELESILDNVMPLAQHAVGRRSIELKRVTAGGLPSIECDPEQMTQVLLNLVINAVEASPEGSTVILRAAVGEREVEISVIDEGSGVAPEDVDRLFDPFFTTKESGTGLGLPVAHQIVSQMHGVLSAHRNPDRGMTFSLRLPLKQRAA